MQPKFSRIAIAIVAAMRLKGVGRRAALRLVEATDANLPDDAVRDHILMKAERQRLDSAALSSAWRDAERLADDSIDSGIGALAFHDEAYPSRLRNISDPPAVLFYKGKLDVLDSVAVAIIGTREPTPFGAKVAQRSGQSVAEAGFSVVSGLAHGCDTFAHRGCIEAKGIGVAVLAHGLDKVYPAANRDLATELVDTGGCLVSEYPLGMTPMRTAFAERDRIQSGLSDAVLVIETDVKGGTMHTVRFAREQRRRLACIAHPPKWLAEEKARGNQALIADRWATPIGDGGDLIDFLGGLTEKSPGLTDDTVQKVSAEQLRWSF